MSNLFVFANDASTTLSSGGTGTSLTLAPGTGALFPNPSAGQQFELTLTDAASGTHIEIVYCTARVGDVLTVVRAQEGTSTFNYIAGDLAALLVTAGQMQAMQQVAALYPARIITASGAFAMSSSDANGGVGLNRVVTPAVSSTTLPNSSGQYWIEDIAKNFNAYPVTVAYPGGTAGPDGATSQILNINSQCAAFRLYPGNLWSYKQ